MSFQFSSEDIRAFLKRNPHSSVVRIIEHLCPGFSLLSDTQRLKVWTELRATLRRMEQRGQITCAGNGMANLWRLDPAAGIEEPKVAG